MNVTKAILHINPEAKFVCWDNDFDRVEYNDAQHVGVKPTLAECQAAWEEIKDIPEAIPLTIEQRLAAAEDALLALMLGGI